MQYALLAGLWIAYGTTHSILAGTFVKSWMSRRTGGFFRYYRLLYNAIALVGLVGILAFQAGIREKALFSLPVVGAAGWVLLSVGLVILAVAFAGYDLGEFSGLRAVSPSRGPTGLRTGGLLRYVRHPLYSGAYLLLWGWCLAVPLPSHLVTALVLSVYIRVGIYFEEHKLLRDFGDAYAAYRQRVPMLIPKLRSQ